MAKIQTVPVKYKKRVLRVEAKTVMAPEGFEVKTSPCAKCGKKSLKLIELIEQRGIWQDQYQWLCYCPTCEFATIYVQYEEAIDDNRK